MSKHEPSITLEVCVDSLASAQIAANTGAQRIELNAALALGGLTPSIGLTEQCMALVKPQVCEVIAMVRPRPSGFTYNSQELSVMGYDVDRLIAAGVDGIALGVLNPDGTIDEQANLRLIKPILKAGKQAVFHRAFDLTPDPTVALESLIAVGFHRVLTSGQAATAIDGAGVIRQLIQRAAGRIEVLPGSGITAENAGALIRQTGCTQVHASLRTKQEDITASRNPEIQFNSTSVDENSYDQTDASKVKAMMQVLFNLKA